MNAIPGTQPRQDLPFAALPHALWGDPRLRDGDAVLAAALLRYARDKADCWPSNARLAADLGVSIRTVQYRLRRLEQGGWVRCEATDDNRTGRLVVLAWREPAPPVQPVARPPQPTAPPPTQGVAPEEDRVVKEKTIREETPTTTRGPTRVPPRETPHAGLFQSAPPPRPAQATPPNPPAPAPARRPTSLSLEELARLAADDPILAGELARRTAPRPEAPPPPPEDAPTAELIGRVRECPTNATRLAHRLTVEFHDQGSYMGYLSVAQRAWRGEIPPELLADAYRQACNPLARKPGAIFMTVIRRGQGGDGCRLD